jgi:putative Mg2+ transporter-C (MgtC) family protein
MLSESEVALRLISALTAGAVLGWEREAHNKPAGIKTHMLVALGSAAFMLAGLQLHEQLLARGQSQSDDLLKVLAGLIGGVGFLGAGSILRSNGEVHRLTTASTIWTTSAVGVACSLGYYTLAGTAVVLTLLTLLVLGLLQRWLQIPPNSKPTPPTADPPG